MQREGLRRQFNGDSGAVRRTAHVAHGRRRYLQIGLVVSVVLIAAGNCAGQDLGALAREEQARKQAQPSHQVHVYTNDDLVRPQILTPNDDVELRSARKSWRPTIVDVPPELATEPNPPEVPLGDLARQNREQKEARRQQSRIEMQSVGSIHVYTNEDMARPQILTPEDRAVFEAAQTSQPPATERRPQEILSRELNLSSAPLGDIARLYRRQNPVPEIQQPRVFHLPLGTPSLASTTILKSPIRPPPRTRHVPHPIRLRNENQRPATPEDTVSRLITVRPGDSLWRLARQYLGKGSRWRALMKASPWIRDPNLLKIGTQIRV
jgi:nucleoid-associated protein YgaU